MLWDIAGASMTIFPSGLRVDAFHLLSKVLSAFCPCGPTVCQQALSSQSLHFNQPNSYLIQAPWSRAHMGKTVSLFELNFASLCSCLERLQICSRVMISDLLYADKWLKAVHDGCGLCLVSEEMAQWVHILWLLGATGKNNPSLKEHAVLRLENTQTSGGGKLILSEPLEGEE